MRILSDEHECHSNVSGNSLRIDISPVTNLTYERKRITSSSCLHSNHQPGLSTKGPISIAGKPNPVRL